MLTDLEPRLQTAVQYFWDTRASQAQKQLDSGKVDAGSRGAVTGGSHLGALEALLTDVIIDAGMDPNSVHTRSFLEVPGYYRSEKKWDLLVVEQDRLVLAVEFKSQVGPSFGNNFNNRTEEAIGNAEDVWTAYREGRFGTHPAPLLGYFFLLEDCPRVHAPVRSGRTNFPVDPVFVGASYAKRYQVLCERLLLERKYNAACLTLATNASPTTITQPSPALAFRQFAAVIEAHVAGYLASGL